MFHINDRSIDFSIFFEKILEILKEKPEGIKEFDLIQLLSQRGVSQFDHEHYDDDLGLFQTHFLLFHTLYRLNDELIFRNQGNLQIHCLEIKLSSRVEHSRSEEQQQIDLHDPLRNYYLDLENLARTGKREVSEMLSGFWKRFAAGEKVDLALDVLGLERDSGREKIQKRYRELVMEAHPDRGGDSERIIQLNGAMEILQSHYGF